MHLGFHLFQDFIKPLALGFAGTKNIIFKTGGVIVVEDLNQPIELLVDGRLRTLFGTDAFLRLEVVGIINQNCALAGQTFQ